MALTTRVLSNSGAPLSKPDGTILSGVKISFKLVSKHGATSAVFDTATGQIVADLVSTTTDVNGIFSINIWPNDRGDVPTQYVCRCIGFPDFISHVPSGNTTLTWLAFGKLRNK